MQNVCPLLNGIELIQIHKSQQSDGLLFVVLLWCDHTSPPPSPYVRSCFFVYLSYIPIWSLLTFTTFNQPGLSCELLNVTQLFNISPWMKPLLIMLPCLAGLIIIITLVALWYNVQRFMYEKLLCLNWRTHFDIYVFPFKTLTPSLVDGVCLSVAFRFFSWLHLGFFLPVAVNQCGEDSWFDWLCSGVPWCCVLLDLFFP